VRLWVRGGGGVGVRLSAQAEV